MIWGPTGSEAWRGKGASAGREGPPCRGGGGKGAKAVWERGLGSGSLLLVWEAASDHHKQKGRAQRVGVWESRAASGQSGIIEQKGPRAAPGSCVREILEVRAAQNKEPGVREFRFAGSACRAWGGSWLPRGRSWFGDFYGLALVG